MKILSIEHVIPSKRISNDDVLDNVRRCNESRLSSEELQLLDARVKELFLGAGTEVRYALGQNEKAIDLVVEAGRKALQRADVSPRAIDFVLYAGVGRAWIEPAMANAVQSALDLSSATCFDILDGCMSWLRALHVSHSYLTGHVYRCGLIVNCESAFGRQIDWRVTSLRDLEHQFASFTIGEAATATVVGASDGASDFYFNFRNFSDHFKLSVIPLSTMSDFLGCSNDDYRPMRLFSLSRELLTTATRKIIEVFEADLDLRERQYDLCVGHAATEKGSEVIRRKLGIPRDVYFPTHPLYGNTVSASVPLGLSLALQAGRLRRGSRVLLIVGGSGIAVGFARFTF